MAQERETTIVDALMDVENIEKVKNLIKDRDFFSERERELTKLKNNKSYYVIELTIRRKEGTKTIAISDDMIDFILDHEIETFKSKIREVEDELKML